MTTKTHAMTGSTTLPLNELRIDDKVNVRKIGRGAEADFIASIKALGIQMPLIVRKNGKGYVVADGGKRYEAALALVKSGDLDADAPIPVIVSTATDAEARELSLALNLVRVDMHPVDAFRAFAALHTDKSSPLDVNAIAVRFGIGERVVNQRLALGSLDDTILDAWRDGKMDEDAARAFTLCPNKKEQVRIYAKLAKQHGVRDYAIKRELKAGEKIGVALNEIGIEAYEKRGGKVTRDLFGDDHAVSDEALLRKLLDENFDAKVEALKAAGWAWILGKRPDDYYKFGQIEIGADWSKEQRAEAKRLQAIVEGDPKDADEQSDASTKAEADLNELQETIALASYTDKQKVRAGCFVYRDYDGAIKIEHGKIRPEDKKEAAKQSRGDRAAAASVAKAKVTKTTVLTNALRDRLDEQRETAIQAALVAHPHKDPLAKLLAAIAAGQIKAGSWNSAPFSDRFDVIADTINPKTMNAALRKAFDAKGYFEGCGKAFCLAAITEAVNADEARKISKGKRAEIAKFALANVGKTPWLPKELRTAHYDGPQKTAKAASKTKTKRK